MDVIRSGRSNLITAPIYGAGADIFPGALMMPGVTAATNDGVLIQGTATSNADAIGVLAELHDYSVSNDALVAGTATWFQGATPPARQVELLDSAYLCSVQYDLTGVAAVSSSGTTVTITSLEDNIDTAFLYVASGTGAGQLAFVDTSASGSCTTSVAFATVLTSASYVVKVLPLYHQLVVWKIATATAPTKLDTTAAVGTGRCLILENHMIRNGMDELMDCYGHRNLTGLSSLSQFKIYAVVQVTNSGFHPID